nr:transposase (putative), gypsy type [Tanacetum cinerariifolium]
MSSGSQNDGDAVVPKFDMHVYPSVMTFDEVKNLIAEYAIPLDLHPYVPPSDLTMNRLPVDKIGIYDQYLELSGVRVSFSTFLLGVIKHFYVHISQLVSLGLNRLTMFEIYCRSLDINPFVPLFRALYKLNKQGHWFSFERRSGKDARFSTKDRFFFIYRRAIPDAIPWRHQDSSVADPPPTGVRAKDIRRLCENVIDLRLIHPAMLYAVGLTTIWKHVGHHPEEFFRLPVNVPNPDYVEKHTLFTEMLISPSGVEFTYALRLNFTSTNNKAEYEALLAGHRMAKKIKVQDIDAKVNLKLVASQINGSYMASSTSMIKYLATANECIAGIGGAVNRSKGGKCRSRRGGKQLDDPHHKMFGRRSATKRQGRKEGSKNEDKSVRPRGMRALQKRIFGAYVKMCRTLTSQLCYLRDTHGILRNAYRGEASGKLKFVSVAIDYITKWIEAKPLARITGKNVKKFVWDNIVCRFRLPRVIVTDNGTQFVNDLFKGWCESLNIKQMNTAVAHPQANGCVTPPNGAWTEYVSGGRDFIAHLKYKA